MVVVTSVWGGSPTESATTRPWVQGQVFVPAQPAGLSAGLQDRPVVTFVQFVASWLLASVHARRIGSRSWLFRLALTAFVPRMPRARPLQKRPTAILSWKMLVV